jgi:hypothetical protein
MSSILTGPLKINGVISTDKTVLQNLNNLATASGCFLTFDINQGKWAVIINRPGTSVASFNDSNIIGSITISETGVSELYNSASVEFPHPDLRDESDFVDVVIDSEDRYPNEVDNNLSIQIDCINNPIQAQYLASIELKQSRLNKIITFSADYTSLGLKAGDLIDVTSSLYGFTSKVFRITKIEESDEDTIGLTITALEYSENVYDDSGLTRSERTKVTGILLKEQNTAIQTSDDVDTGNQLTRLLLANAGAALLRSLFSRLAGNTFGPATTAAKNIDKILSGATALPIDSVTNSGDVCEGGTVTITVSNAESVANCNVSCLIPVPDLEYAYTITGVTASDINVPLTGTITVSKTTNTGTLVINTSSTAGGDSSNIMTVTVGGLPTDVVIYDVTDASVNYSTTATSNTITEGSSTTVTLTLVGGVVGQTVPYTITGDTGRITSPSLTGNVTLNSSSQASLTINTSVTAGHTGNDTFVVTFDPSVSSPCVSNKQTITVNDSTPFQAPTTCQYIDVPVIWCGEYSGYDEQLQDLKVLKTARLPVAQAGETTTTVPLTVSVSKGSSSTISVTTTATVATSSSLGGMPIQIITAFNNVGPKGLITGSSVITVYGYFV